MIRVLSMSLKRQDLPPGLWVVATPIGNLDDLSVRALRALESADLIFCEDTRRVQHLLSALGVSARGRLQRLDAHSNSERVRQALSPWVEGRVASMALLTDAGTPAISDPGGAIVSVARGLGVPVHPIPGPSAVVAALSVAGREFPEGFRFAGFFPRKEKERVAALVRWLAEPPGSATLWFESPERISSTLQLLKDWSKDESLGGSFFFKELTKVHESFWSSESQLYVPELIDEFAKDESRHKGEWGFVLFRASRVSGDSGDTDSPTTESPWMQTLLALLDCGVSVSLAAKHVSQRFGVPKNSAYEAALRASEKK